MSNIDTGGKAFPLEASAKRNAQTGMNLRDFFAAKTDISIYAPVDSLYRKFGRNPTVNELAEWIAEVRYIEADFMLAARNQGSK